MNQLLIDFDAAVAARDAGLAVAEQAANDDWKAYVRSVVLGMGDEPFMAEDVRAKCTEAGVEADSHKHWGMIFKKLANEGVIEAIGYRKCKSKQTHGHPAILWQLTVNEPDAAIVLRPEKRFA